MTTLDREVLDQMVEHATTLCKTPDLPDRSGFYTLLRFAMATPSPREVELFVRYQASRFRRQQPFLTAVADRLREADLTTGRGGDGTAPFLTAVADRLRESYSGDIDQTRRFLGVLTRAGLVARPQSRGGGRG